MPGAKGIVFALIALRESGNASRFAQACHRFATTGQYFVRISLVAYIPYQAVIWRVVDVMQRDRQLNHA